MKVKVELEVPDDFEPYTVGCAAECPFGYWNYITDDGYRCDQWYDGKCPMESAEVINGTV